MKRDDFTGLPPSVALGWLWDVLTEESRELRDRFRDALIPKVPPPPKWDQAIYRRDGVQWASETDADGLRFWKRKASESSDPKYAESDAKKVKSFEYWLAWRAVEPYAQWTGERNRRTVTAAPPSTKPTVYEREPREPRSKAREDRKPMSFDEEASLPDDDGSF